MTTGRLDITADAYHRDEIGDTPTLSSSIAKILCNQSPAHAREAHPRLNPDYTDTAEAKFDLGTSTHSILLEGVDNVHVVHADNWTTKAAKEERDQARQDGQVPLLEKGWDHVCAMVDAVNQQLHAFGLTPRPFTAGQPEVAMTWEMDGVQCRTLIDWLADDLTVIDDLKTTSASAHPLAWAKTAAGIGCDIQVATNLAAVEAVYGARPDFRYVVVETAPPYALTVLRPSAEMIALGRAKLDHALTIWKRCLDSGYWPGYAAEVAELEPPGWAMAQWMEREALEVV